MYKKNFKKKKKKKKEEEERTKPRLHYVPNPNSPSISLMLRVSKTLVIFKVSTSASHEI